MKYLDKENSDSLWELIYLDNHLLVVAKAADVCTQPDLHQWLKDWLKKRFSKPGNVFLEPIHRLDRSVSGLVVFARTSKALARLNEAMRKRQIQKIYVALVEDGIHPSKDTLIHYLVHDEFRARVVSKEHQGAKEAELNYHVLKATRQGTLVHVELKTGRYHQIRAQLAHAGYPIIGDHKYGSQKKYLHKKIALHHQEISFEHPVTKQKLTFQCEWPDATSSIKQQPQILKNKHP